MSHRIKRNAERKAGMAERRARQLAREPGFNRVMKTRKVVGALSQTIQFRKKA